MPVLSIGRGPESGLPLPHALVSRRHAELRTGPQGPILTDLGSSNGTFIGKERLLPNQPRVLVDGAVFRIGPYTLTYRRQSLRRIPGKQKMSSSQSGQNNQNNQSSQSRNCRRLQLLPRRPLRLFRSRFLYCQAHPRR